MENNLSLNPTDFNHFLLIKLIDLETDLILQKQANQALFLHINPEKKENLNALNEQVLQLRPTIRQGVLELYQAQLQGLSAELDQYLATLLNEL